MKYNLFDPNEKFPDTGCLYLFLNEREFSQFQDMHIDYPSMSEKPESYPCFALVVSIDRDEATTIESVFYTDDLREMIAALNGAG